MLHVDELTLGGGAARGPFQFGFIRTLVENENLKFGKVTGTSAGAINAYLIASGAWESGKRLWLEEVPRLFSTTNKFKALIRGAALSPSLFPSRPAMELLEAHVFPSELRCPVAFCSVDSDRELRIWESSNALNTDYFRLSLLSSFSIPGIFQAVDYIADMSQDASGLVDGGIVAMIPPPSPEASTRLVVTTRADLDRPAEGGGRSWLKAVGSAYNALTAGISIANLRNASTDDTVVHPYATLPDSFDFSRRSMALSYSLGVQQAEKFIEKLAW